jgi:hypothetical protein
MVICIFPVIGEPHTQIASNGNAKIGLEVKEISEVNAGTLKTINKKKKSKYKKKYIYKKVKIRYKYKGKWRTKWVYKRFKVSSKSPKTTKTTKNTDLSKYAVNGNPQISDDIVSADAKCSCSLYTDYNIHKGTWKNYCPYCTKTGTLSYTNEQGCPEGMFYCDMSKKGCDADFCIVHGKAHTNNNPKYLNPA